MYFSITKKKKKIFKFFFIILDSIYFNAIQAAGFYQKNASKIFRPNLLMFLDLHLSCDQNKN